MKINEEQKLLLAKLLEYSDDYEIKLHFYPTDIYVYISKDGVPLNDFGGDFDFAIGKSVKYLYRINGK